jgi:hypothetical protein
MGAGALGLIVDLPGGFIRRQDGCVGCLEGRPGGQSLHGLDRPRPPPPEEEEDQRFCCCCYPAADHDGQRRRGYTAMLLDGDCLKMRPEEFRALWDLVVYSERRSTLCIGVRSGRTGRTGRGCALLSTGSARAQSSRCTLTSAGRRLTTFRGLLDLSIHPRMEIS